MSDLRNPFNYPINPEFGQGVYRRRIRLSNQGKLCIGEMEDCNHGFTVAIEHQDNIITKVDGKAMRIPLTTCAGAYDRLQRLVGKSIQQSTKALVAEINPASQCTHWFDLALLAINHCRRGENAADRIYDVEVPDEADAAVNVKLWCNQQLLLDWQIADWVIHAPNNFAGNTLFKGFAAWANAIEDETVQEAAFILQKGYFVSRARRFDIAKLEDEPANKHTMMRGACFSYSEPQVDIAKRTIGTVRDFTDCPEQLLKFQ